MSKNKMICTPDKGCYFDDGCIRCQQEDGSPAPAYASAEYWYAEYVRERKKHMAAVRAVAAVRVVNVTPYAWTQPENDRKRMLCIRKSLVRSSSSAERNGAGGDDTDCDKPDTECWHCEKPRVDGTVYAKSTWTAAHSA